MAKGDYITIDTRTGEASVVAQQNGRRVEMESLKDLGLGWIVIKEVTRGGTVIRETRVVSTEVVSVTVNRRDME